MSRQTTSGLLAVLAQCHGCAWTSEARNAIGNAARHHDATGHYVQVEVTRLVAYGDANTPAPGQLDLVEVLEGAGA